MLKARGSGGRQTRSRTAKGTPKRASAPAKVAEEPKSQADVSSPKRASAPAKVAEEDISQEGTCSACICILLRSIGVLSGTLLVVHCEQSMHPAVACCMYGSYMLWSCRIHSAADGFQASLFGHYVEGWDQACDVLYTDLMSLMYPDDNTHSLMLHPSCPFYSNVQCVCALACCMQSDYTVQNDLGVTCKVLFMKSCCRICFPI